MELQLTEITHWSFWISVLSIIMMDMVLAGDNAVVIAMAARRLPHHLQQRAIVIGAAGAVLVRIVLTTIAAEILTIPLLQAAGGLILIPIAVKLLLPKRDEVRESHTDGGIRAAIQTIIIADVVMSLDNILAVAGAAHGSFLLVVFGLAVSIPIVIGGSTLLSRLMERFPWLVTLGAAVLGYTSGSMIVADRIIGAHLTAWLPAAHLLVPLFVIAVVLIMPRALRYPHRR